MILTKHNTLKRLTIAAALLLSAWASQAQVVTRGTEFYLTFLPNVPLDSCKYFYLAATAEQNGTLITFTDGAMAQNSIASTPRSLPYTYFMNSRPDMVITASNPIECVQSHASRRRNDDTSIWGDASTAALLPTNSFVMYARIPYFATDSSNGCQPRYFINVVTHAGDTATIFLDSIPLHGSHLRYHAALRTFQRQSAMDRRAMVQPVHQRTNEDLYHHRRMRQHNTSAFRGA